MPSTDLVIVRGLRAYCSNRDRPCPRSLPICNDPEEASEQLQLVGVRQFGFDRVIQMDFEHGGGRLSLIIELFRDGNVLLLDQEGVIIRTPDSCQVCQSVSKEGRGLRAPSGGNRSRGSRGSLNEILRTAIMP